MKIFLILLSVLLPISSNEQIFSATSNHSHNGMLNMLSNPANLRTDSLFKWDANLFSIGVWGGGTSASMSINGLANFKNNYLRENILGIHTLASGGGGIDITGPSVAFKFGKNSSFGIGTRVRMFSNFWNVDGRLVSEIGEDIKEPQNYPYNLSPNENMVLNAAIFSDINISYTKELMQKGPHFLKGGITLKYISGMSHTSIDVQGLSGTVGEVSSSSTPYLTNASGNIVTRTSGSLFDNVKLGSLTSALIGKGGVGADVGFIYDYRPLDLNPTVVPYKFRLGVSVTDIGKIAFSPDRAHSGTYNVHISANDALYFNNNFNNTSFSYTSETFDKYPALFTRKATQNNSYKIGLPAALRIFVDANLNNGFFASGDLNIGLQKKETVTAMYVYNSIAFTPRYERNNFVMSLPFIYQGYTHFSVGLGVNVGSFYVGSGSLLSGFFTKTRQLDGFIGLRINPDKKKEKKSIPNKNDYLPIIKMDRKNDFAGLHNQKPSTTLQRLITGDLSMLATFTTSNTTPYWMHANQYGSIPLQGGSISTIGSIAKNYDTARKMKLLDWGMGLEERINVGKRTVGILTEAYAKVRIGIIELKAGRSKDKTGIADSDLSVGNFSISGNTLGVPKIDIGIREYWRVPFIKWLAFKGNLVHGWFGNTPLNFDSGRNARGITSVNSYYHESSLFGRIGKQESMLKFYGGITHEVMWGHERETNGDGFKLSTLQTFWYVLTGKTYGATQDQSGFLRSKVGNHLGSIDQSIELNLPKWQLTGYHQFIYDIGALFHLGNAKDGLFGLSIKNKHAKKDGFYLNKAIAELFFSKSQAGEPGSMALASGPENYYNNYLYAQGWTYKGENLGNSLLTSNKYMRGNLPRTNEPIVNNRVIALNLAMQGEINQWEVTSKITFSKNYGTWLTAPAQRGRGDTIELHPPPYFPVTNQFSGYLEAKKQLKNGYKIGGIFALDAGKLLYNSAGIILKISKSFN